MTKWSKYLVERACDRPPPGCSDVIVKDSTPVLFFGNPRAKVATLGINPSRSEFLNRSGVLLSDERRRLATLPWLGVRRYGKITSELGSKIIDECARYFEPERNPYGWFNALDEILREGIGASYFNKTACHLDLAQWATSPVWGKMKKSVRGWRAIQSKLLADGINFLRMQLDTEHYDFVLVNGRAVICEIQKAKLTKWNPVKRLNGPPKADLYTGEYGKTKFLAWSCNIQSQPGARRHIPALARFVAKHSGKRRAT
ncbi:MAG: hypothetical protein OXU65_01965 [Deltaproteobacteria bacterium]|nr:hypothetical protein [Deltaproteobacteria bacterium]